MLAIETRPIARLIPYVRNARTHSGDQIAQIAGSIAEFGFVNPVLIGADDVIIAGHGRVLAAEKLGPCRRATTCLERELIRRRWERTR